MISESINLFTQPAAPQAPTCRDFDGKTFDHERDATRLGGNLKVIFDLMKDGVPRTLAEIRSECDLAPDAAVAERLRDLRKKKFGGHSVESIRPKGNDGVWKYRLVLNQGGGGK